MNPVFRLKRFSQLDPAGPLQSTDVIPLGRPDKDYQASFAEVADELQSILTSRVATCREVAILKTSGTWTAPENIIGAVHFRMVGAGASGSVSANINSPGRSGVPGGYAEGWADVTPGNSYAYLVGAGGAAHPVGTAAPVAGNSGGSTQIFGVTAEGGPGDAESAGGSRFYGGGVTGPAVVTVRNTLSTTSPERIDGGTPFGVPAHGGNRNSNSDSSGYGVGGLGGATTTSDGGSGSYPGTDGKPGLIILEYFVTEVED